MITMHKAADRNPFSFAGYHCRPAHCHLRVYVHPDRPTVVIASELASNPGTSITNRAEHLATLVCHTARIDPDTMVWIEHYPTDWRPERFSLVEFARDRGGRLAHPRWTHVSKARVEAMIGRSLED
jgi:hypothetical protein